MTTPAPDQPQPFIIDDQARSWFMTRRGGGHLYDEHLALIRSVFADDVSIHIRAAVDPTSGQPTVLIIEIDMPMDDDESWAKLVRVQQLLIERREDLAGYLKLKDPYRRVVLSPSGNISDWDHLATELGRDE
jgi:hypothetical protein